MTISTHTFGWDSFYDVLTGPHQKPREFVHELLRQRGPMTVPELKQAIEKSGYPAVKFGERYYYLYTLLKRSHRGGVIGWGPDERFFLHEKKKTPTRSTNQDLMGVLNRTSEVGVTER